MRKSLGKALRIGLSRAGVTLLQTSGWLRPHTALLVEQSLPETDSVAPDLLASCLSGMLVENKCTRLPATVVLADDLVRLFMVTPPQNASRLQDCKAAAEIRFRTLYGESSADWQIESGWQPLQPFLACALPKSMLNALQQVASEHRLTLVEIAPHFISAWNGWHSVLNGSAWFGVAHEKMLTVGAIQQQRLCSIRSISIPQTGWHDQAWLPAHLGREALRLNLPIPQQIQLYGDIDGSWTTQTVGSLLCSRLGAAQHAVNGLPLSAGFWLARSGLRT